MTATRFKSFFMGGFECSTHIRADGRRLDLLASTRHDTRTDTDYRLLQTAGIHTVRDGLRWHRIEAEQGVYDWSSFLPMLRAAHETGTEVIWDLCHWGVPDWLSPFQPDFPKHFAHFARSAAEAIAQERVRSEINGVVYLCPINEISFWSWIGGDLGGFAPFGRSRGPELKRQLVRAVIHAIRAVRAVLPLARFVQAEPLIHIASGTQRQTTLAKVQSYNEAQFEAWDMICGRMEPDLGGSEDLLDILGVNYYWDNQWIHDDVRTPLGHPAHVALHELLVLVQRRYGRPIVLSETGAEDKALLGWLGMICSEVRQASFLGADVCGICVYPISDYSGWDDNRHVRTGLLALGRKYGQRTLRFDVAKELSLQARLLELPS